MATAPQLTVKQQRDSLFAEGLALRSRIEHELEQCDAGPSMFFEAIFRSDLRRLEIRARALTKEYLDFEERVANFISKLATADQVDNQPINLNMQIVLAIYVSQLSTHRETIRSLLKELNESIAERRTRADSTLTSMMNVAFLALAIFSLALSFLAMLDARRSGKQQEDAAKRQQTLLEDSLSSLQQTVKVLSGSASDLKEGATAAKGQYDILQIERTERQNAVLRAAKDEVEANLGVLKGNEAILAFEFSIIDKGQHVTVPLRLFHTGAWDLLKLGFPPMVTTGGILGKLKEVSEFTYSINDTIRSRENYRIQNEAMSNFKEHLKSYDDILRENHAELRRKLETLRKGLP